MQQWANYFIAVAGGAAALTGLLFVSVSLNLKHILSFRHLTDRALEALLLLANILLCGSFCLIPQSLFWLGCEVLFCSLIIWLVSTPIDIRSYRRGDKTYRRHYLRNLVFTQLAVSPFLIAGAFMLSGSDASFYLLVPGITMSFIKSLSDAWVLLIEINR